MAIFSTCAVVLVVMLLWLLLYLLLREEATGPSTLERLPEDGNISPQFNYEGNCTNVLFVFITFLTHFAQAAFYSSV